ncbi:MAG: sigma 54-interacting transcriptional regulator [Oligoflexia bacterium]|nr:sigma 54-interacting transcriptional regulator [Oligoflexia bacterium]
MCPSDHNSKDRDGADEHWHSTILDSVADGVFTVDPSFRITSFNRAAERITGYTREQAVGHPCHEIFKASICRSGCALRQTLETGVPLINIPVEVLDKDERKVPISISTAILKSSSGERVGGVETFRDLSAIEELRRQIHDQQSMADIVGCHPGLQRTLEILPDIARSDATVLIQGPSGSGKGLLASTIHRMSARAGNPFIKVSCAALPESLLESELFGYEKGAFTDARKDKLGRIALADKGTLFLDEIGDVPLAVQVKLLRFLQDREYEPLGATRTRHADVRVVAATHRDLVALMREGKFREDLFYRLNIIQLSLPGLSERREDIPHLVQRFLARQNFLKGMSLLGVTDEAMKLLMAYDYPGNIRELENAIEYAFVLCRGGYIQPNCLPATFRKQNTEGKDHDKPALKPGELAEAEMIRQVLKRCGGSRLKAAEELQVHRSTLWRKIERYDL